MKKKGKKTNKSKLVFSKTKPFFTKKEKCLHICDPLKCHTIDQSNYCFYQTTQTVKIYVTLPGVESVSKSNIKIKFHEKGFELSVFDLSSSNFHLIIDNLADDIVPSKCKHFTRKDKLIVELTKEAHKIWRSLETVVTKDEWIQSYCEYLEDIPEFIDADTLNDFAEGMWDQMLRLQDNDFNYLKPPPRMQEIIPSLRKQSSFKSLEAAINFYKDQLKKDCFSEPLYIILGGTLFEKLRVEKLAKISSANAENIEETAFKSTRTSERTSSAKCAAAVDDSEDGEVEKLAEAKKAEGNEYYRTGKFYAALQMYLEAIELWPENAFFYSNASASYMMLGLYSEALSMAQKAVKADPSFSKGFLRIGKCNLALGNSKAALKALAKAKELDATVAEDVDLEVARVAKLQEYLKEGRRAVTAMNYLHAATLYDSACSIASASSSLLLQRAEYLIMCDKMMKAKGIARNLLEQNVEDADAHCIFGMVSYYQDEKENALKEFEEALRISRSHTKAKSMIETVRQLYDWKEAGNKAYKQKRYKEAVENYSAGLLVDPKNKIVNAKLHYNLASVQVALKDLSSAVKELTVAIEIKKDYVKAYLKRASLHQDMDEHSKAVQDLKIVWRLEPTEAHKNLLDEAQERLKKQTRKNYYEILSVPPTASEEDIKNAYKRLAMEHHPDRHADKKEKQAHEQIFKDITEAYSILKDPNKRGRYDADETYDAFDGKDVDKKELFKLFLFTQFLNRNPDMANVFFDEFYYDDDDDDDDDYDDDDTDFEDYDYEDDYSYYSTDETEEDPYV